MEYLKYIFENEDVKTLVESNEAEIADLVNESLTPFVMTNFKYVVENCNKFIDTDDLVSSFESIKTFIRDDLVSMLSAISEVAALDESCEHVSEVMRENVSNVFTGVGYGTQKAQRLISTTYC